MNTEAQIRRCLMALDPVTIDVIDDSAQHAGHAGASGGGHFRVVIVSPQFSGRSTMARHRLVYHALGSLMQKEIHALSLTTRAPQEN
jgi:BolA family transcriptional regulator, general stress-responsive regulator